MDVTGSWLGKFMTKRYEAAGGFPASLALSERGKTEDLIYYRQSSTAHYIHP